MAKPTVTGITSLGIDHVQVLGNTIEEIAWHKAGIMKTGSPAYTVWQPEGAMQVLKRRAEERQVKLREVSIGRCLREVDIELDEDFQKRSASLAIILAAHALLQLTLCCSSRFDPPGCVEDGHEWPASSSPSRSQPRCECAVKPFTTTALQSRID